MYICKSYCPSDSFCTFFSEIIQCYRFILFEERFKHTEEDVTYIVVLLVCHNEMLKVSIITDHQFFTSGICICNRLGKSAGGFLS